MIPAIGLRQAAPVRLLCGTLLLSVLALSACDLDIENPNDPTEEEVLSNLEGIIALSVGMQGLFASSVEDFVLVPALVSDEWGTRSRALISYISLMTGENFDQGFEVVEAPFANAYAVIRSANNVLRTVPNLNAGAGLSAGMTSLAKLYKGMSLGMIIMQYERVPVNVSGSTPAPEPRAAVLDSVIALLESARADLQGVPDTALAGFRARVLGKGFDLDNTINAMLARYYLLAGKNAEAIAAADRVNLAKLSVLTYEGVTTNPIYSLSVVAQYVAGLRSFADQAEPGDKRPAYWLNLTAARPPANPADTVLVLFRKYAAPTDAFPVYLPDEMRLIKAEALARQGNLPAAIQLINQVRTQTSSAVDEPVAGLPPVTAATLTTQSAVLRQIAYERRYELYAQGLRWEDFRRLPQPVNNALAFTGFLPLPTQECQTNPAAGC